MGCLKSRNRSGEFNDKKAQIVRLKTILNRINEEINVLKRVILLLLTSRVRQRMKV
jgi:hypothetical protein